MDAKLALLMRFRYNGKGAFRKRISVDGPLIRSFVQNSWLHAARKLKIESKSHVAQTATTFSLNIRCNAVPHDSSDFRLVDDERKNKRRKMLNG